MNKCIRNRLGQLKKAGAQAMLRTGLKGLEKESLRVTPQGTIAQTPHPAALGSSLTHPYITTDYSEALIELVTPPFQDASKTLVFLDELHQFVYEHIGEELLLATSMPCRLQGEESIPIAYYGNSNIGRMKRIYRQGLAYRYGRPMQAIAGIHFNYSVDQALWPVYRQILGHSAQPLDAFIAAQYFGMIRNIHRYGWLLLYLFGCSPAICKSFFVGREAMATRFTEFDSETWYRSHATSLRMSDIGYKNDSQSGVSISLDDLSGYVDSLTRAIETSYAPYQKIGVKVDGEYRQLNANLLQIENEYYSPIRPKQTTVSGEKPTLALKRRGVQYLELRSIDLNCFHPDGISLEQLQFLENFMLFCLLLDSPSLSDQEKEEIGPNALAVACCGRSPGFTIRHTGMDSPLKEEAERVLDAMQSIAEVLDGSEVEKPYQTVLEEQRLAVLDSERTPSARLLTELRTNRQSFADYALTISRRHAERFRARRLDSETSAEMLRLSEQSLAEQKQVEANDTLSFDAFLAHYFNQS